MNVPGIPGILPEFLPEFPVDGIPTFDLSTDGTSGTVNTLSGTEALVVDEWARIVVARSTGTVKLSVDGTEVASMVDPGAVYDGAADLEVGEGFTGALDEMRLSISDRVAAGTVGEVVVDYVYNERNQLTTETSGTSVKTYTYDNNGNVTDIIETVGAVEVSNEHMTYDQLNRMLTHTGPKGTEVFTYRGAEWHRASANGKSFLYDGDNVIADISGGATSAFYVTPFLDQNLSITSAVGTYYYSQDGLGSVRTLTDSTGAITNNYDYLPFGGAHQPGTNVTVEQRYTYTGREKNPESALMYYRYRQYDPRVGRFGGRDPIGYSGDANTYTYVLGRPTGAGDPFGEHIYTPSSHVGAPWSSRDFPGNIRGLTATYWDDNSFKWEVRCNCYCDLNRGWLLWCFNVVDMHIYLDPDPSGTTMAERYGHEQQHLKNMLECAKGFEGTVEGYNRRFNRKSEKWRTQERCTHYATSYEKSLTRMFRTRGKTCYGREANHAHPSGKPPKGEGVPPDGPVPPSCDDPLTNPGPINLE